MTIQNIKGGTFLCGAVKKMEDREGNIIEKKYDIFIDKVSHNIDKKT